MIPLNHKPPVVHYDNLFYISSLLALHPLPTVHNKLRWGRSLPPGPMPLPFVGNLLFLLDFTHVSVSEYPL
jgi:hypothetical protein